MNLCLLTAAWKYDAFMLSDTGSLSDLPSCAGKPNFQLAQSAWCGQQQEPVACFKDTDSFLAKEKQVNTCKNNLSSKATMENNGDMNQGGELPNLPKYVGGDANSLHTCLIVDDDQLA
jgi:hypothetical protein